MAAKQAMKENLQCTSKYGQLRISQDICHVGWQILRASLPYMGIVTICWIIIKDISVIWFRSSNCMIINVLIALFILFHFILFYFGEAFLSIFTNFMWTCREESSMHIDWDFLRKARTLSILAPLKNCSFSHVFFFRDIVTTLSCCVFNFMKW